MPSVENKVVIKRNGGTLFSCHFPLDHGGMEKKREISRFEMILVDFDIDSDNI